MKRSIRKKTAEGQAVIVLVMIMAVVGLIFTHVTFININALTRADEISERELLHMVAEGYTESAAIRYLRDGSYSGESLIEGDISCTIVVTDLGGSNRDFETTCTSNGREQRVGMQATYSSGVFAFSKLLAR